MKNQQFVSVFHANKVKLYKATPICDTRLHTYVCEDTLNLACVLL